MCVYICVLYVYIFFVYIFNVCMCMFGCVCLCVRLCLSVSVFLKEVKSSSEAQPIKIWGKFRVHCILYILYFCCKKVPSFSQTLWFLHAEKSTCSRNYPKYFCFIFIFLQASTISLQNTLNLFAIEIKPQRTRIKEATTLEKYN